MLRKIIVAGCLMICIVVFSFFARPKPTPSESVKKFYLEQTVRFKNEIIQLQRLLVKGEEKIIAHTKESTDVFIWVFLDSYGLLREFTKLR